MRGLYKELLFVLIAAVVLSACGGTSSSDKKTSEEKIVKEKPYKYASMKDGVLHLDLNEARKHSREVKLSEICDSLIYIPLETKKECLLGRNINGIEIDGDDVFIHEGWKLLHFDKSGKFLEQLGKTGRGPGEYVCGGFFIDKSNKRVCARGCYRYIVFEFDYNGRLLSDTIRFKKHLQNMVYVPHLNTVYGSLSYCITQKSDRMKEYNIYSEINLNTNKQVGTVSKFFPDKYYADMAKISLSLLSSSIYSIDDDLCYQELGSDTIFKRRNGISYPHIILNNHEFMPKFTSSLFKDVTVEKIKNNSNSITSKIPSMVKYESERFVFMDGYSDKKYVFDKEKKELIALEKSDDIIFKNDFDGLEDFKGVYSCNKQYIYSIASSDELLEKIAELSDSKDVNEEYRNRLIKISKTLDEESNPVIVLARLNK